MKKTKQSRQSMKASKAAFKRRETWMPKLQKAMARRQAAKGIGLVPA